MTGRDAEPLPESPPSSAGHDRLVMNRKRAAAVTIRDGQLLMVREVGTGPTGRHDGQPRLGSDDDLPCDCPRMLGLSWVSLPQSSSAQEPFMVPTLLMATHSP